MTRQLLSDSQWSKIENGLPGKASDSGVTAKNNRRFVEAVLWVARTGSPWRDLPSDLSDNWNSTYIRFNRWCISGVWHRIMMQLGTDRDLEVLMMDSTVVRAHQHAAGAPKKRATKRSVARGVG